MPPRSAEDWQSLYGEVTELFSPGAPIQERDLFSGRQEQIKSLLDAVRQRGKHACVFGEAGLGKTSIATTFVLAEQADRIRAIKINCQPDDTLTKIWKRAFKRVALRSSGETLADLYDGEISTDDIENELDNFAATIDPVIVFDEFNCINDKSITEKFSRIIKNISDNSSNCTIVLVGISDDVAGLVRGHSSIVRQLVQVKMPRMTMIEIQELVLSRLRRVGMKMDEGALWKLAFLSRGMPYCGQLMGMHAARSSINRRSLSIDGGDLDEGISNGLQEIDEILRQEYLNAIMSKKSDTLYSDVLLACALTESDELGRFQQKDVEGPLSKLLPGKHYKSSTYAFHMNEFCEPKRLKVLENVGREEGQYPRYRFRDPLMQPYVIMRAIRERRLDGEVADSFIPPRQASLF